MNLLFTHIIFFYSKFEYEGIKKSLEVENLNFKTKNCDFSDSLIFHIEPVLNYFNVKAQSRKLILSGYGVFYENYDVVKPYNSFFYWNIIEGQQKGYFNIVFKGRDSMRAFRLGLYAYDGCKVLFTDIGENYLHHRYPDARILDYSIEPLL